MRSQKRTSLLALTRQWPATMPKTLAALGARSAWHHALSKPTHEWSRGFALLPIQFVHPALHVFNQGSINKQFASKTVADTLGCTHTCIEPSGVYLSTGSCIKPLPFEFVASRSLPLKAGFTIGWSCPRSMLSRAQHSWFAFLAKRSSRLVRHLLRPPSRWYHAHCRLDRWRLLHTLQRQQFSIQCYSASRLVISRWAQTTSHDVFSPQAGTQNQ